MPRLVDFIGDICIVDHHFLTNHFMSWFEQLDQANDAKVLIWVFKTVNDCVNEYTKAIIILSAWALLITVVCLFVCL